MQMHVKKPARGTSLWQLVCFLWGCQRVRFHAVHQARFVNGSVILIYQRLPNISFSHTEIMDKPNREMSVDELERCLIDSCFPEEDMAELERAGSYRLSF